MQYNFSIIIPHKEIPLLLERCINSIPSRDDIQIIVVDDNSDTIYVEKLMLLKKEKVFDLILTKEGKGAGHARNLGLKQAKGKWILFADADDYYEKNVWNILDKYIDYEGDAIFWACNSVMSEKTDCPSKRHENINHYIFKYLDGNATDEEIKYRKWEVWSRMYRKRFLDNLNVKFDEISIGNDLMFVIKANHNLDKFKVISDKIYCVTHRSESITFSKYTDKKAKDLIDVLFRFNTFCKQELRLIYCMSIMKASLRVSSLYMIKRHVYALKLLFSQKYSLFDEVYVCVYKFIKLFIRL